MALPSIYQIKPAFQNLLRPITRSLASIGVTANQVTIFACLLSFIVGALLFIFNYEYLYLVPALLFVRMALNAIDGMLAREHGMKSNLGAILNELTDVLADAALYFPFAYFVGFSLPLMMWIIILSICTEMIGVVAIQIGASRRYDGPMGKSDRAFVFGIISILILCRVDVSAWINNLLSVVLVLLMITIVNRARSALKEAPNL